MFICQFCNTKEYEKILSVRLHERYCKCNPNKIISKLVEYNQQHNIPSEERKEQGRRLSERYKLGELIQHPTIHSDASKKNLSDIAIKRGLGGYVKGSGRGKRGWYNGFFCDSSYELAYVIYCLEHNISIQRNTQKRQYIFEERIRNYTPDFIVNNEIVEIKGFSTPQWEAKLLANPDVKVLYKKDLKHIFEYVIMKYGKDFINLYEVK